MMCKHSTSGRKAKPDFPVINKKFSKLGQVNSFTGLLKPEPATGAGFTKKGGAGLDTIAHLGTNPLPKRAKRKFLGDVIKRQLAALGSSPLQSSYYGSCLCSGVVTVQNDGDGQKAVSKYCNARWCIVCGAIRTAKAMNGYLQPLTDLHNDSGLYLVTLTRPNVRAESLTSEIEYYFRWWSTLVHRMKKRRQRKNDAMAFDGLRKFECTYNLDRSDYHPHFHIIVAGLEAAEYIKSEWLSDNETASTLANDVRPIGVKADDLLEVLKYATKLTGKSKKGETVNIPMLDVMNCALQNRRVLQPFGSLRSVKVDAENIKDLEAQNIDDLSPIGIYQWLKYDWLKLQTSEPLCGYIPSSDDLKTAESWGASVAELPLILPNATGFTADLKRAAKDGAKLSDFVLQSHELQTLFPGFGLTKGKWLQSICNPG